MADITVRSPQGDIVEVPEAEYEKALRAGYQNVSQEEADAARQEYLSSEGLQAGVDQGLVQAAPGSYSPEQEALAKFASSATFGLAGLNDPASQLNARRFQEERPGLAFAAEVAGQLPAAIGAGALGEAAVAGARAAGLGQAALGGVRAADFAAQAAIGGAQTEAERARVAGERFSPTNAAVAGVVGEAFGRGVGAGFSAALGTSRNLIARAEQRAVAQDTSDALSRGGFLNDFRVAAHADQYQNELSRLAADDLDRLETNFAEVSRQDRKRARIARVVEDHPAEQAGVRAEALGEMQQLYDALYAEIGQGSAPGPARRMLDQLRERMDLLQDRPSGARLWRQLDENRQALQEYAQDLHQAYEDAPGSAWLSREALGRLDAAERVTRETLLREDVWGQQAAREQAAYNVPFHEKYFPTVRTVRGKLMFPTATDARGFPVFRGDPARVRAFFTRAADGVDAARLGEQFTDYLDGVEAIARAGERDTPRAARETLEAVRRLRKAAAHAEYIQATAARMGRAAVVAEVGAGVVAGVGGLATGGTTGLAMGVGGQAVRGLRMVHWLSQAARKLGWAGDPQSMSKLLGQGELPRRFGPDTPESFVEDLTRRSGGSSEPPPGGPGAPPGAPPGGGGPGGRSLTPARPGGAGAPAGPVGRGLTPSELAEAGRQSWQPSAVPGRFASSAPAGATASDELGGSLTQRPGTENLDAARPGRAERAARETTPVSGREVGRGQQERLELDPLRDARGPAQREAARLNALREGEFRDVVQQLRASDAPEAKELADRLESSRSELESAGLVAPAAGRGANRTPGVGWQDDIVDVLSREPDGLTMAELRDILAVPADATGFQRAYMDLRSAGRLELRDGRAYLRDVADTHAGAVAAKQAFADLGVEIRMGAERLGETLDTVFGAGKAPTAEQWRQIIPLDLLAQLGPARNARVDVLGDAIMWQAHGPLGVAAPYREWDGTMNPGGLRDDAWKIARTFSRNDAGELEVHHDHFFIREDLQGTGVGAKALKRMMTEYRKIGVDVVTVDSVEVGKYFWPSIGFNHPDKTVVARAIKAYERFLQTGDNPLTAAEAAQAVKGIRSMPGLAQAEFGKEFLLNNSGPWNFGLRLKLNDADPMYHLMRGRLDIAAAGLAALGAGALEGGRDSGAGADEAPAGAAAPMAGFAATAALFNRSSARLVAGAARRLFSTLAEPALKSTARLAYSRAQLHARRQELTAWHQNPEAPGGLIERVQEGFRDAPPEAFAEAAAASYRALAFLRARIPQSGAPSPVAANRGAPVSAEAAAKYARYEQAALYPGDALREASEAGYLSPELMETMEELYPDLLAELRVSAYQAVQDAQSAGGQLSIQAKTQYARLFDGDGSLADPTFAPDATKTYAYAYEQAAAVAPPKTGAGPRPGVSQMAAAVQAPQPWRTG